MPCNWLLVEDTKLCKNPAKGQYCATHAFKIRKGKSIIYISIIATVQKTKKPKTNSFTSILDQVLNKYNLLAESNPLQLHAHADELSTMLLDWKARKDVKKALHRRLFKENQIEVLVPDKRKKKLIIEKRALYCAKTGSKSNDEIVASCSRLSLFRNKLAKAGIAQEPIDIYAKLLGVTTASNKIQKEWTEQDVANNQLKIPPHFSLEKGLKRIQNIDTTKDPLLQDLADVIMMLCMRPAEVSSLQIDYYEVDPSNPSAWYKNGENKDDPEPHPFLSMEKNPECARALLIWIQEAIKAGKLSNPTFNKNGKHNTRAFSKFLKPYKITSKILRKIGGKHACRVHGGPNPTHQHLDLLNRIALRHKIVHLDAGKNYAIGDTESEDSDLESESDQAPSPISESQASSFQPKNNNSNPFESQIAEIDSMLASF
ncbi:4861_t:CDS:2 [Cetraspora pellucida]|uniref:4861_t:CDS:1 n=1 Tax=Cetraspora pellucida TaxID=1433469 RepID=A0A9N9AWP1_9GLOM|nr:4861_t:CDS:2 [Cetraspora pellucida]